MYLFNVLFPLSLAAGCSMRCSLYCYPE